MTVLVAVRAGDDGTWLGSDSQASLDQMRLVLDRKWVVKDRWGVGLAGHWTWIGAAERLTALPARDAWAATRQLRAVLKELADPTSADEGHPSAFDLDGILVDRWTGGMFVLDGGLTPVPILDVPYAAAGGGRNHALGALHILHGRGVEAGTACHDAVSAAIRWSTACGGPVRMTWLDRPLADPATRGNRGEPPKEGAE